MAREPVSGRLMVGSILQVIESLALPYLIQIRDRCNEIIIQRGEPKLKEPEEFRTWRVKSDLTVAVNRNNHGGFGLYRSNTK